MKNEKSLGHRSEAFLFFVTSDHSSAAEPLMISVSSVVMAA